MSRIAIVVGLLVCSLIAAGSARAREVLISGNTMGTTYHIKVVAGLFESTNTIEKQIEHRLAEINGSMSTYLGESEISRFNRFNDRGEKFSISSDFLEVMVVAQRLYRLTLGAWDGTVKPLVNQWGFGSPNAAPQLPTPESIRLLLSQVGFNKIEISPDGHLTKLNDHVTLDLASIAKGFGVDQVAEVIAAAGFDNFLVEIGGEVYAAGRRPDGKRWQIGINRPRKDAALDAVYQVVALENQGFATSGDYRNFFERDGARYSHVIDPRSGRPVANGVVSVSIIADTCTFADGLATAVMVMGAGTGIDLVNRIENVECLVVVEEENARLRNYTSRGFPVAELN